MNFRENVFDENQKLFYGDRFHTTKRGIATSFEEDDKNDMERLEKLEKQGWKRMELKEDED